MRTGECMHGTIEEWSAQVVSSGHAALPVDGWVARPCYGNRKAMRDPKDFGLLRMACIALIKGVSCLYAKVWRD
jgi:hypothetical protein